MPIQNASDDAVVKVIEDAAKAACEVLDQQFPGHDAGGITSDFQGLLVEVLTHMLRGRSVLDAKRGHYITLTNLIAINRADRVAMAQTVWNQFNTLITNDVVLKGAFLHFPAGTHRFEVWEWFEEHFGISLYEDLMFPSTPTPIVGR